MYVNFIVNTSTKKGVKMEEFYQKKNELGINPAMRQSCQNLLMI